ncbi:4038_t:CDS:1, partial [Racocetra persica]
MSSLMMKLTKSGDVQLSMDFSLKMGIFNKSIDENSLYNELSKMSPCTLYLKVVELIVHSKSRRAVNHKNKPRSSRAPRPQNAFFIFRRNFTAKLKKEGKRLKKDEIGDYSKEAAKEWHENPQIH